MDSFLNLSPLYTHVSGKVIFSRKFYEEYRGRNREIPVKVCGVCPRRRSLPPQTKNPRYGPANVECFLQRCTIFRLAKAAFFRYWVNFTSDVSYVAYYRKYVKLFDSENFLFPQGLLGIFQDMGADTSVHRYLWNPSYCYANINID